MRQQDHHQGGADEPPPAKAAESGRLLHELEVHQIELELQNQELREAQLLLDESRARYAELYDDAPVGYCTLNRQGVIGEMNLCGARLLGKPRAQLVARPFRSVVPPESRPLLDDQMRRCLVDGVTVTMALTLSPGRAAIEVVELVMAPTISRGGTVLGCLMALLDITDRKRDEAERARLLAATEAARARAEEASRIKDEFLAVISHELRSPVAATMMWTHLLRKKGDDPAFRRQVVEALEASTRAQLKLLDDLLEVVRGRAGKLRIDEKPLSLARIVAASVMAAAPAAAAKELTLDAEAADAPADTTVVGDEVRLGQVFDNLLSNAIKFTPAGRRVRVRVACAGREAVVSVEDEGEGIAPNLLPHVFEPFRQEERAFGERRSGLGLGLAIVKQLVEAHGGRVAARSAGKGQGTTLTVTLPHEPVAAGEALPAPSPAATDAPMVAAPDALAGVRVLVVEDDAPTRAALTNVLETYGAVVSGVASAGEGCARIEGSRPEVLVSDIVLPDGDGYAIVRRLRMLDRRSGGHSLAVAVTSLATPGDRDRALAEGFDQHFAKPMPVEALISFLIEHARPRTKARTAPQT